MGRLTSPSFYQQSPPPTTGELNAERTATMTALAEFVGGAAPETCTISDGVISPTSAFVLVDTEDQSAADDLTSINIVLSSSDTLHNGMVIYLQAKDADRVVTVKNSVIHTADGNDLTLNTTSWVAFRLESGVWWEVATKVRENFPPLVSGIYVDPTNGDNTNDGLTSDTALATITKALELVRKTHCTSGYSVIYLASDTYNEDVEVEQLSVRFVLSGDITVKSFQAHISVCAFDCNGNSITISEYLKAIQATISISGDVYVLEYLAAYNGSFSATNITINSSVTNIPSLISDLFSYVSAENSLNVTSTNKENAGSIAVNNNSSLKIEGTATISHSGTGTILSAERASNIRFGGATTITSNSNASGISARTGASIHFASTVSLTLAGSYGVVAFHGGTIYFNGKLTGTFTGSVSFIYACGGVIAIVNADLSRNNTTGDFLVASDNGMLYCNTATLKFSGSCRRVTMATTNGTIELNGSTKSGSVTGQRYYCDRGGQIYVGGQGANAIPGSTAGAASSATYSYYG